MSFFRTETVAAPHAGDAGGMLARMRRSDIDGVLVKGVYPQDACACAVAELESNRHDLIKTEFPAKFAAFFYGINLNLADPDLTAYFAAAAPFRSGLARLAGGALALEQRLTGLMSQLDGARAYRAAPAPQGGSYMFTTIRAHLPGGYIPAHFDDEQAVRPSYRLLRPLIQSSLFSFVLAFSLAEDGGALEVFDLKPARAGQPIAHADRSAAKPDLTNVDRVSLRLDPGDMILFNSGRFLHRVTPVVGARTRWTVCSFMAESRTGDSVYCWG